MERTRYREERTLARGVRRLPGETREVFRAKVARLREHFERFNRDTSDVCQWLMSFRQDGKQGDAQTKVFWDFFLEPESALALRVEDVNCDRHRRLLFDSAAKLRDRLAADASLYSSELLASADVVSQLPRTKTTDRLFERLGRLNPAHRQVLLKAAAEWVLTRYQRGVVNWKPKHEEWDKERRAWEEAHPQLTPDVCERFNRIFKELGILLKNPRVCGWERLQQGADNCQYAGERRAGVNHGPLCKKFDEFFAANCRGPNARTFKSHFLKNARAYVEARRNNPRKPKEKALAEMFPKDRKGEWFPEAWHKYLDALGILEDKALNHCVAFGGDAVCLYNPHTNECTEYKRRLAEQPDLQPLEALYREWRKLYLAGPGRPRFRYPSSRVLPTPKIFGSGFFCIDFDKSQVGLRLDDMPEGTFEYFAFHPWPPDYVPQPDQTEISSVNVHFVGVRARIGFRFQATHKPGRLEISQDDLEDLRRRKYPRQKQDQLFLNEARERLRQAFPGDLYKDLKIMAVDLGTDEACAAYFAGKNLLGTQALKIVKIDKVYTARPEVEAQGRKKLKFAKVKGLSKEHVAEHMEEWAASASGIALHRTDGVLGTQDLRKLALHSGWMIRDWARLNAARIVEAAQNKDIDLIVFESLRGFRAPGYDVLNIEKKRQMAFFAYGKIFRKVTEKAVERGMRVVTVPYLQSSQHCAACGVRQQDLDAWRKNKKKRRFKCEQCGNATNSDANAAQVIAKVFWGDILLPSSSKVPIEAS